MGFEFVKLDAEVFLEGLRAPTGRVPAADICRYLSEFGLTLIVGRIEDDWLLARILGFGVLLGQGHPVRRPEAGEGRGGRRAGHQPPLDRQRRGPLGEADAGRAIPILSSIAALAATSEAWIVDIWGVMHNGARAHPAAGDACRSVSRRAAASSCCCPTRRGRSPPSCRT